MKKVNLSEKVQLDKEIISKLSEEQLSELEGGALEKEVSCITGNNSCAAKTKLEAES